MHHVIIGGGPAAIKLYTIFNLTRPVGIMLACDEPAHSQALPYWLAGSISEAHTHTGDAAYFTRLNVATRFGVRVVAVDPPGKTVSLSDGNKLEFDDLLIATGSSPARPPIPGADLPGVEPLWSLAHTDRVLKYAESLRPAGRTPRVVLVGAGFIGFIVLNAMHKRKWQLTVVEREPQVLPRMLDVPAADHVLRKNEELYRRLS
jgi:NADPH-dependent 2,4-dienoyl-CoA reductase/sulfur reductase-like enzyme